jgi:hypothetical protein
MAAALAATMARPPQHKYIVVGQRWRSPTAVGGAALMAVALVAGFYGPFYRGGSGGLGGALTDGRTVSLSDNLGSSWPYLAVIVIVAIGAVDAFRGSPVGLGAAGGAAVWLAWQQILTKHAIDQTNKLIRVIDISLAWGGYAMWAAVVIGICLAVMCLVTWGAPPRDEPPWWIGLVVGFGAALWTIGMCMPPYKGISTKDWLWGSSDDTFNFIHVCMILFPAIVFAVAAARRSAKALGMALGCGGAWFMAWFSERQHLALSLDLVQYTNGSFQIVAAGMILTTGGAALGLTLMGIRSLIVREEDDPDEVALRPKLSILAVLATVLVPVLGLVALVGHKSLRPGEDGIFVPRPATPPAIVSHGPSTGP